MNNELINHWNEIMKIIPPITSEDEYQARLLVLNELIDTVGEDEQHPLASLLHFVGVTCGEYEKQHYPEPEATPQEVLAFLMQEHQLKQSDLPEIGSQGVVSEILNGKRCFYFFSKLGDSAAHEVRDLKAVILAYAEELHSQSALMQT